MRLQRWPLQDIALELSEKRGFDVILDFASGLPTNDHIHQNVKPGTTVIYSDFDPVVIEYSHDILKNAPNIYFFQSDSRRPEELVNNPEVKKILGGRRRIAFVYWGVSLFLSDKEITHAVKFLYDWAAPGSCLVFNAQAAGVNIQDPAMIKVVNIYEQMGSHLIFRSLKQYEKLIKPWKMEKAGFIPLLEWNGLDQSELGKDDVVSFGPMGGGYGAYLNK
jgi:hypothetical protein